VEDVAENGVIRGTRQYNKDEFVSGAKAATSCRAFSPWSEAGKIFYKVREQTLDPRNFKDSGDVGTLAVRYVVQPQGGKNTVLRIDAIFEEDFRHTLHPSNGSVESSEYKDIQEHLDAIEVMTKQDLESESERKEQVARKHKAPVETYAPTDAAQQTPPQALLEAITVDTRKDPISPPDPEQVDPAQSDPVQTGTAQASQAAGSALPAQTLEDRVKNLRQQIERVVKPPGAPLKSAPFHTAGTLQTLTTGTDVLILISTPYWFGVETHEGQHGWIMRDQLEQP